MISKKFPSTLRAKETSSSRREAQVQADAIRYNGVTIGNEILMCLRASQKRKGDVSLQEPIGVDGEGNEITLIDVLGTEEGAVHEEVERRLSLTSVRQLAQERLHGREKMVIQLRYGLLDGKMHAQQEIAQLLGISRSYVSRRANCKRRLICVGVAWFLERYLWMSRTAANVSGMEKNSHLSWAEA